jgi:polar amino acid transport system substrate-binding protein
VSAFFTGCRKENAKTAGQDNSLANIIKKKKLIMGLDDTFPPMTFRSDKHEITGFDVDLAKEAANRIGVTLVLQPIDWNIKEKELNEGHIDCIWSGFGITEERARNTLITLPYLGNTLVFAVKANSPINNFADLNGKTVGTQAATASEKFLNSSALMENLKTVVLYNDFVGALMDMDAGSVDAVAIDLVLLNDYMDQSGRFYRILDETLADTSFGIGFRLGEKTLANKVWETLLEMARDGTISRITTQWFGSDISLIGK